MLPNNRLGRFQGLFVRLCGNVAVAFEVASQAALNEGVFRGTGKWSAVQVSREPRFRRLLGVA